MNAVQLVGRLARDPEVRYTQSNYPICTATIAVDRNISKDKQRDGEPTADFIKLKILGKSGETFSRYLTKGRQVAVEGRIETSTYENKDGQKVNKVEVIVSRFDFIGGRNDNPQGEGSYPQAKQPKNQPKENLDRFEVPAGFDEVGEDDLPFN